MTNISFLTQLTSLLGSAHVLYGPDTEKWQTDWTGQYRNIPLAVVRPGSTQEISAVLALAYASGIPVVPISGNTGLTGGSHAVNSLIISLDRMNRVRQISTEARIAVVEAGVVVDTLNKAAMENDLIFPLSFGATGSAQIGGVLSTNAGGSNVIRYGNTRELCLGLEVVMPDGRILDLMQALPKNNSGLDLKDLFIGAEGQIGIITAAIVKLYPRPTCYATAMVTVNTLELVPLLFNKLQDASNGSLLAYEFMSANFLSCYYDLHPNENEIFCSPYPSCILIELETSFSQKDISEILQDVLSDALEEEIVQDAVIAQNDTQRQNLWKIREAAAEVAFCKHPVVDTDIAVPLDKISVYLDLIPLRMKAIDPDYTDIAVAHLGDGNIHYTVWPSKTDEALCSAIRTAIDDLAVELGGTFSAEHGVGLCKLDSMQKHKNPVALEVMRSIKSALDPKNLLNPGKTIP
nr:FAD-binding oxidoreductase [uncultured Acetobacter sp.]